MINMNEFESQIDSVVNNTEDVNATEDQIEEIADRFHALKGFDFYKGDDIDSIDTDVFWGIVEDVLDGRETEPIDDWRA